MKGPSDNGAGLREREAQGMAKDTDRAATTHAVWGEAGHLGSRARGPDLVWHGPGPLSTAPQPLRLGLLSPPSLPGGTYSKAPVLAGSQAPGLLSPPSPHAQESWRSLASRGPGRPWA